MSVFLEVENITKYYGRGAARKAALDDLSLTVASGSIFGLLGPNGAGKSTLLRVVLGLVRPDAGTCRIFGQRLDETPGLLRSVGSLIETTRLYPFLTGDDTLSVLARYSGATLAKADRHRLLGRVGLADAGGRKVGDYSLGMKQRLGIACALIGRPKVVVLDEPTNGMDPAGILDMRTLFRELVDQDGVTVMLSSHMLDEVQRVCDHVGILNRGRLAACGAVADLIAGGGALVIEATPVDRALAVIGGRGEADKEGRIRVAISREEAPALLAALITAGVHLYEAKWAGRDLEKLFVLLTESDDHVG